MVSGVWCLVSFLLGFVFGTHGKPAGFLLGFVFGTFGFFARTSATFPIVLRGINPDLRFFDLNLCPMVNPDAINKAEKLGQNNINSIFLFLGPGASKAMHLVGWNARLGTVVAIQQ